MLFSTGAAEEKGEGSMQKMENVIIETIEELNLQMFSEAKREALDMFNDLKVFLIFVMNVNHKCDYSVT